MKVLLIQPGMDAEWGKLILEGFKYRRKTPILAVPYLAALTPPDVEVEIIDEVNGVITDLKEADLVVA